MKTTALTIKTRIPRVIPAGLGLLVILMAARVQAYPGLLDQTFGSFGTGGKVSSSHGMGRVALQTDGKILTAGRDDQDRVEVIRYLSNGTLDPTFDGDGIAAYSLPGVNPFINAIAVQPDGKIVVAGENGSPTNDFLVVRLTTTGALDGSFGVNGYTFTDIASNGFDNASDVLVQPDGKIVLAGTWSDPNSSASQFAIARYNTNGNLDLAFAGTGRRRVAFTNESSCLDVALQSDGKLVMTGDMLFDTNDFDFAVARVNADGTTDNGFDGDGILSTGIGGNDFAGAVAIQSDGKIVVAGGNLPGGTANGEIVRYLTNGALDNSFDGDGKRIITGLTGNPFECDVAIQPDGQILYLDSKVEANGNQKFALYRMSPNGALDPSLDANGEALIDFNPLTSDHERGTALALLPDGRILVVGVGNLFYMARLWPDGSIDQGGQLTMAFQDPSYGPNSNEQSFGMAIQADGKIVAVGDIARADFTGRNFALARMLPDGQLDPSFGDASDPGRTTFGFGGEETAKAVVIQPDGKIVAAGTVTNGSNVDFMVARFNPDGTPDGSFGFLGYNTIDFTGGADYGLDMALAPDGKIVVAGTVFNGHNVFGVARFNANGTLDNSFDADGKQFFDFGVRAGDPAANAVVVQPDRKIVLGGRVGAAFALVRFDESGSVDGTFGSSGAVFTDLGGVDVINELKNTGDGGVLAAGTRETGSVDFALARYTSTGALNTAFGVGGIAIADLGGYDEALAMDMRYDGTIAVAGRSDSRFAVAQFRPDGTLDTGFFGTGYNTTDLAGGSEAATGVAFSSDRIVLTGYNNVNNNYNIGLSRFETTAGTLDAPGQVVAKEFALTRLSPNPTRSETRIEFQLPRAAHVRIGVYDTQGRLVAHPVDADRPAGRHAVTWSLAESRETMPAGVYFVRFEAGGAVANKRLVILP
jgi:uncharacterized delta-60 repeat protein